MKVLVTTENDDKEVRDYSVDELKFRTKGPKERIQGKHEKELQELKELEDIEKEEGMSKLDE